MQAHRGTVVVALDGPAGAGKSTVSKAVAQQLGYSLLDTGALYRAVALVAARRGIAWDDDAGLATVVADLPITFSFREGVNRVFLDGDDITDAIRTEAISRAASQVSARPVVRTGLLELQRRLAGQGGAVLEGRDIGTVVCPDAPVKFFLDASCEERARRRYEELKGRGQAVDYDEVLAQVQARDASDRNRAVAPLRPADDAVILDCTTLTVQQVVERVVAAVRQAERRQATATCSS